MKNRQSFFNSRALFWGFGISNIMRSAQNGFWISIILGTIVSLAIMLLIKKSNNSKIVKFISGMTLIFLTCIILVNMGSTLYLRNTPVFVLSIVPIIGAFIISKNNQNAFFKTLKYIFIFSIVVFAVSSLLLVPQTNMDHLLPVSYSIGGVLKGTWIYVLTSTVPVICLNDMSKKDDVIKGYLLSSFTLLIVSCFVMSVLGSKEAILCRYPEYIVLKRIRIFEFFSNVENLFVGVLVADLLFTMASGFRNIEIDNKYVKYLMPIILLFLVTLACSSNATMTMFFNIYPLILLFLLIVTIVFKK